LVAEKRRMAVLLEHLRSWRGAPLDDLHRDDIRPFLFYPVQKLIAKERPGF